ncbi:UNVERIFIED_CONTAM: Aldose 1-epimerase [Sesamum calycinum]|uniref:Aldose 1-epimerase n=1 Tax=Sesamum calycinum TaxID=2727403 RepID=A0AAW2NGE6_9LAMI
MGKAYVCLCVVITAFALRCEGAEEIGTYELERGDFSVKISNYGATVLSLVLPDRNGKLDDVVLGYGSIDEYKKDRERERGGGADEEEASGGGRAREGANLGCSWGEGGESGCSWGGGGFGCGEGQGWIWAAGLGRAGESGRREGLGGEGKVWPALARGAGGGWIWARGTGEGRWPARGWRGGWPARGDGVGWGRERAGGGGGGRRAAGGGRRSEGKKTNDTTYFGAIVGRVANRIGGAKFTLNGKLYNLPANDHGNTLHGGTIGFSDVVWTVESYVKNSHLTLTYHSHDGEQGFPGDLSVMVTYMLIDTNKLGIKMQAKSLNKPTPVNLASHTYWNLGGHTSGDILSHTIQLRASRITPVDDKLIPTGEISPVKGTPYDFLEPRKIGSKFTELPDGYDINYVLDRTGDGKHFTKVATVHEEKSGRKMELWTDQPGVQFYTSNMLPDTKGKGGFVYKNMLLFAWRLKDFLIRLTIRISLHRFWFLGWSIGMLWFTGLLLVSCKISALLSLITLVSQSWIC